MMACSALPFLVQPRKSHIRRTGKADKLAQVAGHEVAQPGDVGDVDEADEELPLQPICGEDQPLRMRPHKLLHCLLYRDREGSDPSGSLDNDMAEHVFM